MIEVISQDKEIFLYLNNLGSAEFDAFWKFVSGKWSWIPLYAGLLYLLYRNYSRKELAVSDQIANIFKYSLERLRPCHDAELQPYMRIVECGGSYGFYSSHASNTFLLASFLSPLLGHRYRFLPVFLFVWAGVVSYSRIYLGVHFPLDVLMGTFMGIVIGRAGVYAFRKISYKKKEI